MFFGPTCPGTLFVQGVVCVVDGRNKVVGLIGQPLCGERDGAKEALAVERVMLHRVELGPRPDISEKSGIKIMPESFYLETSK